jgi:hypothetical protein
MNTTYQQCQTILLQLQHNGKKQMNNENELYTSILALLPNAVFGEENTTGEILVATGLRLAKDGTLVELDSDEL